MGDAPGLSLWGELPRSGDRCSASAALRSINRINVDHSKSNILGKPVHGFKTTGSTYATINAFDVMHAPKKEQAALWHHGGGIMREVR